MLPLTGNTSPGSSPASLASIVAIVEGEIRADLEVIRKLVTEPDQEAGAALEFGRRAAIEVGVGIELVADAQARLPGPAIVHGQIRRAIRWQPSRRRPPPIRRIAAGGCHGAGRYGGRVFEATARIPRQFRALHLRNLECVARVRQVGAGGNAQWLRLLRQLVRLDFVATRVGVGKHRTSGQWQDDRNPARPVSAKSSLDHPGAAHRREYCCML